MDIQSEEHFKKYIHEQEELLKQLKSTEMNEPNNQNTYKISTTPLSKYNSRVQEQYSLVDISDNTASTNKIGLTKKRIILFVIFIVILIGIAIGLYIILEIKNKDE